MKILSANEKKKITNLLKQNYGISSLPHLFIQFGKEKVRIYSGTLSREELNVLDKNLRVESAGLYLGKFQNNEFRLSLDVLHLLKNQVTKDIVEITDFQAQQWFEGKDIQLTKEKFNPGFIILKHKEDLIGCGKLTQENIIKNYMPKERRVKS